MILGLAIDKLKMAYIFGYLIFNLYKMYTCCISAQFPIAMLPL